MFLYLISVPYYMRIYLIAALILSVLIITSCGGTITGKAVAIDDLESAGAEPEPTPSEEEEEPEKEHIFVEGPTEEQEKFAEIYAGRDCEEDSVGTVRVFTDGQKTVYKNECLGDLLFDFGCDQDGLTSENIKCPSGCKKDRYNKGYCA